MRLFVLRQREFSTLRNKVTMRRVVTCARWEGVGECEVIFALIQLRDLVDASQWIFLDHMFQEFGLLLMIHSSLSQERHGVSWSLTIKRIHLKKSTPFYEFPKHECDHGGPREEEPAESDFFSDVIVADEFDDHLVGSFWIYVHPLSSKKAAEVLTAIQTIVGQVNSEFQRDVTRKIRLGAVSRLHGDSAWEISGGKVREWARTKGFKVTSTARNPSNNSRAERCVGIFKKMGRTMLLGSGLPNSSDLWPLVVCPTRKKARTQHNK